MTSLFPPRESLVVTSRLGTGNSQNFFYGAPTHTNPTQILAVILGCRQVQSLKREEQAGFYRLSRKEALLTVADNLVKAAGR